MVPISAKVPLGWETMSIPLMCLCFLQDPDFSFARLKVGAGYVLGFIGVTLWIHLDSLFGEGTVCILSAGEVFRALTVVVAPVLLANSPLTKIQYGYFLR